MYEVMAVTTPAVKRQPMALTAERTLVSLLMISSAIMSGAKERQHGIKVGATTARRGCWTAAGLRIAAGPTSEKADADDKSESRMRQRDMRSCKWALGGGSENTARRTFGATWETKPRSIKIVKVGAGVRRRPRNATTGMAVVLTGRRCVIKFSPIP